MAARIMKVASGIGDVLWVLMKTGSTGEKFTYHLPDTNPRRGHQVFELLPQYTHSWEYVSGMGYKILKDRNIQRRKPYWKEIDDHEFYLCANRHLELGHRIEDFLPDLPTSFRLEYSTTLEDKMTAQLLKIDGVTYTGNKNLVGIYCSAYSSQRNWNFWDEKGWFEFIKLFHKESPELVFVIIGASFDIDLTGNLMKLLKEAGIHYVDTVGQPLSVVIEILKRLNYFIGFPSGLSILNETLGKGTFMFYPPHLNEMINAWADPKRIESREYKGALFCSPDKAFDWIKNSYQIFDRL